MLSDSLKNALADIDLIESSMGGNLDSIKKAIAAGANPQIRPIGPLMWASRYGHLDCVKHLIPTTHDASIKNNAFKWAAINGHIHILLELLPFASPKDEDSQALVYAAKNKNIECVKFLLPISDSEAAIHKLLNEEQHEAANIIQTLQHQLNLSSDNKSTPLQRKTVQSI